MTARTPSKILIIEDDPDILNVVQLALESEGYEIFTAENGIAGLESIVSSGMPDLILLDMKMPLMNGWEFASRFHSLYDSRAPILVMTAAGDAEQRANDVQADGWIGKPFGLQLLLDEVKRLLEIHSADTLTKR